MRCCLNNGQLEGIDSGVLSVFQSFLVPGSAFQINAFNLTQIILETEDCA